MKKILFLMILFICMTFSKTVLAEKYYQNSNNIIMSLKQQEFIDTLYSSGYSNLITKEEFEILTASNIFEQKIFTNETKMVNESRSTSITTNSRNLKISKACSDRCVVTLTAIWNKLPNIKSYDLIGMRFANTTPITINQAYVKGSTKTMTYSNSSSSFKSSNIGFGYSVKLNNDSSYTITTSAVVKSGGTVYGAYEHAISNITLENSKKYSFSSLGQGSVFLFNGASIGKYDNVAGVQISV